MWVNRWTAQLTTTVLHSIADVAADPATNPDTDAGRRDRDPSPLALLAAPRRLRSVPGAEGDLRAEGGRERHQGPGQPRQRPPLSVQ
jgi:hypothetical protein